MINKLRLSLLLCVVSQTAWAGSRERAKQLHDRIAGVPPSASVLDTMAALIDSGDFVQAAAIPLSSEEFLRITVKNMVSSWTNVDLKMDVPLNDYVATAIGLIRDDMPFDQLLYGDIIYTAAVGLTDVPAYSPASNAHYEEFDATGSPYLTDLVQQSQSSLNGLNMAAGILTTRAFGEAYYDMGTNRRPVAFTVKTFLCRDMEQMNDVTRPDPFVRRDVERSPGGDPLAFKNQCAGCHSGMDPLAKAFAHFDFVDGAVVYDSSVIPEKVNRNGDVFPRGFVTQDENWTNLWTEGPNAALGWNGEQSGTGPASYGRLLAATDAFPRCMAEKVFNKVCLRSPVDAAELGTVHALGEKFGDEGFNMKTLFTDVAEHCIRD